MRHCHTIGVERTQPRIQRPCGVGLVTREVKDRGTFAIKGFAHFVQHQSRARRVMRSEHPRSTSLTTRAVFNTLPAGTVFECGLQCIERHRTWPQHLQHVTGAVDDGRLKPHLTFPTVEHDVDVVAEIFGNMPS